MIQAVTSKNRGIRKRDQLELWAESQSVIQELGPWYLDFVTVILSWRQSSEPLVFRAQVTGWTCNWCVR